MTASKTSAWNCIFILLDRLGRPGQEPVLGTLWKGLQLARIPTGTVPAERGLNICRGVIQWAGFIYIKGCKLMQKQLY